MVNREAVEDLAVLIREALCKQDEHFRTGAREVPLWDYFPEIQEAIEKALGITGLMSYAHRDPTCGDDECESCEKPCRCEICW